MTLASELLTSGSRAFSVSGTLCLLHENFISRHIDIYWCMFFVFVSKSGDCPSLLRHIRSLVGAQVSLS